MKYTKYFSISIAHNGKLRHAEIINSQIQAQSGNQNQVQSLKCAFEIVFLNTYCLSFVFHISSLLHLLVYLIIASIVCEEELRVSNIFASGPSLVEGGGKTPKQCSGPLMVTLSQSDQKVQFQGLKCVVAAQANGARNHQYYPVGTRDSETALGVLGGLWGYMWQFWWLACNTEGQIRLLLMCPELPPQPLLFSLARALS